MFIKNYTDTNFTIKYKGGEKTLEAHDVTYIDDNWISYPTIYAMFGDYIGLVDDGIPIEEFLFDNQILAESERIYTVQGKGPGAPRIFVKGGKATFYFADGTQPQHLEDMITSPIFTDVEGIVMLNAITNYIAVKIDEGAKVIFTNFKLN